MAKTNDLTINVNAQLNVDDATANMCFSLLGLYCNTHECDMSCTFFNPGGYCNFEKTNVSGESNR